jgi:stage II sporulation protein D
VKPLIIVPLCAAMVLGAHAAPSQETARAAGTVAALRVGFARSGGYTVTSLPLETYVARVLAGEAARGSRPAALEALAITIRTFALANQGRHRGEGFDLCDQTHCQVVRAATEATVRAAEATAGRVLMHEGVPAEVFYSASCGGRTEVPSGVWPGAQDPPYLPSHADEACDGEPAWEASLTEGDLLRALRAAGFRGERLRDMRILSRNDSGRVARLRVDGLTPDEISAQDLRMAVGRTLGWQHIKSAVFELDRRSATYRFRGHGSGHGVGMCVIGSTHLAEDGKSAEAILAKYFPGLAIQEIGARVAAVRPRPLPFPGAPVPPGGN